MFSNKFVVSLKVGGKVLREVKDLVEVPFGSEYEIYLKNLNDVDAAVQIAIDGKNAFPHKLLVKAGESIDVKSNGENFAFKFIEKTAKISQHRGNKSEDGLLTVSYQFVDRAKTVEWSELSKAVEKLIQEKYQEKYPYWPYYGVHHYWPYYPWHYPRWTYDPFYSVGYPAVLTNGGLLSASTSCVSSTNYMQVGNTTPTTSTFTCTANDDHISLNMGTQHCRASRYETKTFVDPVDDMRVASKPEPSTDGITVAGREIEQNHKAFDDVLDTHTYRITLKLVGKTEDGPVAKPTFTREKLDCGTCGEVNPSGNKFCRECGTNLKA